MSPSVSLFALGSNKLTLALLLLLIPATTLYQYVPKATGMTVLMIPSTALMINFVAAIIRRKILVNKPLLLLFHVSLFVLMIELVIGQLTYLKANTEVGTGETFTGRLNNVQAGPWHRHGLTEGMFTNLGFTIKYHAGIQRDATINRIRLHDGSEEGRIIEIGDHVPLVLGHYRFYTSHNKGYAPVFTWQPKTGSPQVGSVHLPAYPLHEYEQAREWRLPGSGLKIWTMLVIEEELVPEDREFSFRTQYKHHLVLRIDDQRHVLKLGDELQLDNGVLRYETLSSWMGYTVDYDWTRPWLLATCLIALLSIGLHYLLRVFRD